MKTKQELEQDALSLARLVVIAHYDSEEEGSSTYAAMMQAGLEDDWFSEEPFWHRIVARAEQFLRDHAEMEE